MAHSPPASPHSPHSPRTAAATDEVVQIQLQQFLDEWHYRVVHSGLAKKWNRKDVLKVFVNLLKLSGVSIDDGEIDHFCEMDDWLLAQNLVPKMPQEMRDGFDVLTQQMQLVVQMASSIRIALESKDPEQLQQVVDQLNDAGLGQIILKQSCVEATKEVAELQRLLDTWYQNMEARLARLLNSSQLAEQYTQQLSLVEDQLDAFGIGSKNKGKQMLLGMADKNDKALMKQALTAWYGWSMTNSQEEAIRKKCEAEVEALEQELFRKKEGSLANLRASLARSSEDGVKALLMTVVINWRQEVETAKREGGTKAELEALQAKLQASKDAMSGNAKSVMARMSGNNDTAALALAVSTWAKAVEMTKAEREYEESCRKAEEEMKERLKAKKDETKKIMERMTSGTTTGLLTMVFGCWVQGVTESRKDREMEDAISKKTGLFKSLQNRQKGNASSVQGRVNEQMKINLMLQCYLAWYTETKVNHVEKTYAQKIEGKRRQLKSVESLFKSFAKQIDEGLGSVDGGDSSGRGSRPSRKSGHSSTKKHVSGTNSLPDIHAHTTPTSAYPTGGM
jgi:hypothetical protein